MKCYSCESTYNEYKGSLVLESKFIGSYTVSLSQYYKCSGCGELLLPKEASSIMEAREKELLDELIRNLPVNQFITAAEAAEMLGITRQAFHKHQRIKKGFIYSALIGGKRLYSKKSVQLFKETKDGRFPLQNASIVKEEVKYILLFSDSEAMSVAHEKTETPCAEFLLNTDIGVTYQQGRYIH
jgi:hypothetical protein